MDEQEDWREHAAWMDDLVKEGRVARRAAVTNRRRVVDCAGGGRTGDSREFRGRYMDEERFVAHKVGGRMVDSIGGGESWPEVSEEEKELQMDNPVGSATTESANYAGYGVNGTTQGGHSAGPGNRL
jgi:hypothetical protein